MSTPLSNFSSSLNGFPSVEYLRLVPVFLYLNVKDFVPDRKNEKKIKSVDGVNTSLSQFTHSDALDIYKLIPCKFYLYRIIFTPIKREKLLRPQVNPFRHDNRSYSH